MRLFRTSLLRLAAALAAAPAVAVCARAAAGETSGPLSAEEPVQPPGSAEAGNALPEETIAALSASLAVANSEAELFRRQYSELRLRMEALGLGALGGGKEGLEERLLQAVNDLRVERERADQLEARLIALSEAVFSFMAGAQGADPELRLALEEQLRLSAALVGGFEPNPAAAATRGSLTDSRVLSLNKDLSLLVGNIGASQGVKPGMPFDVLRDGRVIASVLAVDVRDRIFGGIVQTAAALDNIRVGDQMRVATR